MGSLVRLIAIVASSLVMLGFAFFAVDELSRGSQTQQNALHSELEGKLDRPSPVAPGWTEEKQRERVNGTFHEAIDDSNDLLLGPFAGLVTSNDRWVTHGVPLLLGLLLYGLGLGTLANMLPKQRAHSADWRTA